MLSYFAELFPQHQGGGARGGKRKPLRRDFSASRKKFKSNPKPDQDIKTDKASKPISKDKWKMDSGAKPKGRVMNKRTVTKGKPGMQGFKGKGGREKGRSQVAKFKFKMSKSKK